MKQIHSLQNRIAPTAKWRWVFFLMLCCLTGLGLALAVHLIEGQSIRMTLAALGSARVWYTALALSLLCAFVGLVSHSLFLGGLVTGAPTILLALVNFYKLAITSTPLQLSEFALAGRLDEIASLNADAISFSQTTIFAIAAPALWLLVLLFLSRPLRIKWRYSLAAALAPAALFLLVFWIGADRLVYAPLGVPFETSVSQGIANEHCGVHLGLWRSLIAPPPEKSEYSQAGMETLISLAEEELPAVPPSEKEPPNILLILSESFFDVTTLPGVTFEEDPLADFHALQAEGVSGPFYSRTLGYGTCNIELEILTGINTALMNREDLYSTDPGLLTRLPTVPSLLEEAGYETTMFHLFNDSIYHRAPIFQSLGFDHIYFSGDFAAVDPEAAAAPDYWAFMNERIEGGFYSDSYMTDLFIDMYEQRGEAPLFLYGISMENHSPHNGTKYAQDGYTVRPASPLSGEAQAILQDACQGAANASAALGRLCDYFREQEEPTVILFYGDHRPGLGLADGVSSLYSALGMSPGTNQSQWSEEQLAALHATSYLIWSNDPDYLPADPGSTVDTSTNYFGLSVLEAAGVSLPLYWRLLEQASQVRLMDTLEYHLGRDGLLSRTAPTGGEDVRLLDRLSLCYHDAIYGKRYVTDRLFR